MFKYLLPLLLLMGCNSPNSCEAPKHTRQGTEHSAHSFCHCLHSEVLVINYHDVLHEALVSCKDGSKAILSYGDYVAECK